MPFPTALVLVRSSDCDEGIRKAGNDDAFSMQIRPLDVSGVPEESAASAIASETVPAPASTLFGPLTANFSTPASVVAGQQYALVLERASPFDWGGQDPIVPCDGDLWITDPNGWTLPGGGFDWAYSVFVTPSPPPPPPVVQPATTAPTGQRAAALKKCKKKFPGKAKAKKRKKCKEKANLLPV